MRSEHIEHQAFAFLGFLDMHENPDEDACFKRWADSKDFSPWERILIRERAELRREEHADRVRRGSALLARLNLQARFCTGARAG